MRLRDYLDVLRKRWSIVVAMTVVGLIIGGIAALAAPTKYEATAELYVAIPTSQSAADLNQVATYLSRELTSYATLATTPYVLGPAIERGDLDRTVGELEGTVKVTNPTGTSLLQVSAAERDPEEAAAVANAVADELTRSVSSLSPAVSGQNSTVEADILSPAQVPESSTGLPWWAYPLLGLAGGAVAGAVLAFLIEGVDRRPRTLADLREISGASVAAAIPRSREMGLRAKPAHAANSAPGDLGVAPAPWAVRSVPSQITSLRSVLQRRHPVVLPHVEGSVVLLVTGCRVGDGASAVALALARSFADLGSRVVLVDAHLEDRGVTSLLGQESHVGVTDLVERGVPAEDAVVELSPALTFVPAGGATARPSDVVCSAHMSRLVDELRAEFDVVVLDGSPASESADSVVLSRTADAALLVTVPGRVTMTQLQSAVDGFAEAPVALVANRARQARGHAGLL